MNRLPVVLAVVLMSWSCGGVFEPRRAPALEVSFWESEAIPHEWLSVEILADGVVQVLSGSEFSERQPRFFESGDSVLEAGRKVRVRFALVTPAGDTVATWAFSYVPETNRRQTIEFRVQPDDPCPSFFCEGSEMIELSPDLVLGPEDRLWVKWFRHCIECPNVVV